MTKKLISYLASVLMVSSLFAQTGVDDQTDKAKLMAPGTGAGWVYSNGALFRNPQGNSGFEYPSNSNQYAIFAAGFWIGAKVNGEIRTSINEYYSTFTDGPLDAATGEIVDPSSSKWKLYSITKAQSRDASSTAFQEWMDMKQYGAPTEMDPDLGEIPLVKGDLNFWSVFNDRTSHGETGSNELGIEINQLVWGYARPDVLGDATYIKYVLKNKSQDTWTDTYFTLWSDPDLGAAGDDFVGCDTTLSLGFVYNESAAAQLGQYSAGYDFLQGPIVPAAGETATYNFEQLADHKNLPMTSFMTYENSRSSDWGDPHTKDEIYNYMMALNKVGDNATTYQGYITGSNINFLLTGDPEAGTGWLDSNSGDRRLMMNSGPFDMAPGDEQEFVIGFLVARGSDHLNAVTQVKRADALVQLAYDLNFDLADPPSAPALGQSGDSSYEPSYTKSDDGKISITLNWQRSDESYAEVDNFIKDYNEFFKTNIADTSSATYATDLEEAKKLKFSGYIVTQYPTSSRNREEGKVIAIYDDPAGLGLKDRDGNVVSTYFTFTSDAATGALLYQPVFNTQNLGLALSSTLTEDFITRTPLKEGKEYYYDVKAFASNPWSATGVFVSGDAQLITARPNFADAGVTFSSSVGDTLAYTKSGNSDGFVLVTVVDPVKLTGKSYKVGFHADNTWYLLSGTDTVINNFANQPTSINGDENFPIVDGLKIKVSGAPSDFKDIIVTANAGGELGPASRATPSWQGFPGVTDPGGDYAEAQQVSGAHWFVHANGVADGSYASFIARSTQYTGGFGNATGLQNVVPDDIEFRFTGNGTAFDNWGTHGSMNVPFEVWNTRSTPDDTSDDYEMLAFVLDNDGDGGFGLNVAAGDHPASGASNDPQTDAIYLIDPTDKTAGSAGKDALLASYVTGAANSLDWAFATANGVPSLMRLVFVSWNGGDATDATFPANVADHTPEIGTVFKLKTTKPNTPSVEFTFTAPAAPVYKSGTVGVTTLANVKAVPNPYYGYHTDIKQALEQFVYFNNLPDKATIRVFTLNGELVKRIDYDANTNGAGANKVRWDLVNDANLPIASGIYIYHVQADGMDDKVGKFAAVMGREILQTY